MSVESAIEWTDATWNPVTGCDKISPGYKFKQWGGAQKKRNGRVLDGRTWDGMPEGRKGIGV